MTKAQWKKATLSPKVKRLGSSGLDPEAQKDLDALAEVMDTISARAIWEEEKPPSSDLERETLEEMGYLVKQAFHLYEEPPADLTKWEAIKDVFVLDRLYPAALGELGDPEAFKEEILDFAGEFPDLIDVVVADIEKGNWFDRPFSENFEEWKDPFISLQALYDMNFYGMADSINGNKDVLFPDNDRARINGVSVLQSFQNSLFDPPTDHNGYYIQPEIIHHIDTPYSLEDFYLDEEKEGAIKNVTRSREALIDSYYYIKGFNGILKILTAIYAIPGLDVYTLMEKETESRIDSMNKMIMKLYRQVYSTDYGAAGDFIRYEKLNVIKEVFGEIRCDSIDVPVKKKALAKEFFENMIIFDMPELIEDLMLYREIRPDSPLQGVL